MRFTKSTFLVGACIFACVEHGVLAYKSYFDLEDAQIVIPENQGITGTPEFDYTDPSKDKDNIYVANATNPQNGDEPGEQPASGVQDPNLPGSLMRIYSPDGKSVAFVTKGGNLHLKVKNQNDGGDVSEQSELFYGDGPSGRIFYDQQQRIFHFYVATMRSYGISRFRVHNTTSIPNGSRMVSLYPLQTPNHPTGAKSLLTAATAKGEFYYIAACNLKGQYTKLFLFQRYPEGLEQLQKKEMQAVVTGGEVTDCAMVALTNGANGYSP